MTAPGKPLDLDGMEAVARAATQQLRGTDWRHEAGYIMADDLKGGASPVAQVRGWGYLTGHGHGALGLPAPEAVTIQDAWGEHIATFDPPTCLSLIQTQRELVGALTEAHRIAREMAAYLYPDTISGMDREDLENVCAAALTKALGEQPL